MKKINSPFLYKIMILAAALFAVLSFSTCQTIKGALQEPVISLHSVDIAGVDITGVRLLCKVQVENLSAIDIPFPETSWKLFINDNSFVDGIVKNNQRIKAKQKTLVDVPVNLEYLGIFNSFRSLKGSRNARYKIALGVKIPVPVLGDKVWNFEHNGELPLLQPPKISAPSMKIDSRDLTKADVLITLNIENPNVFALPSFKLKYDYQLNKNSFLKGETDSKPLPAAAVTPVVFKLTVNYADLLKSFASLAASREVSSSINLSGDFGIPAFSGETFNLNASGSLPLR